MDAVWGRRGRVRSVAVAGVSAGDGADGLDDDLVTDAVEALRDARRWRLAPERWRPVADAVETMSTSLAAGDVAAFRAAVHDLELLGPVRAYGYGETSPVAIPVEVDERAEEIVHTLDGRAVPVPED